VVVYTVVLAVLSMQRAYSHHAPSVALVVKRPHSKLRCAPQNDKECMDACLEEVRLLQMVNARDPRDEHHIARLYDYFYHLVSRQPEWGGGPSRVEAGGGGCGVAASPGFGT
jgi:hypothetical protein